MTQTIIGIDPGLASTGVGFVEIAGSGYRYVHHEVIRTNSDTEHAARLLSIYDRLTELVAKYGPMRAGVESLYFARNATSAIPVAEARGVVLLALHSAGVRVREYPPQSIKQAVVGVSRADKTQVQELVRVILGLKEVPRPDHAADALAAAICEGNSSALLERQARGDHT